MIFIIEVQSQISDINVEVCERPDNFKCENDVCTKLAYVCNGIKDCEDGSDEINCGRKQINSYFSIGASYFNLSISDYNLCRGPWYLCHDNKTCISGVTFLCDKTPDCPHGDDEHNCDSEYSHLGFNVEEIKPRNCTESEFRCLDQICISKDLICDGVEHCMDGTDETQEICKDMNVRTV